jgi:hypothetical protein
MGSSFMRNRIINGAMVIDQRNAGASVTAGSGNVYSLDRWKMLYSVDGKFTVQQQQNPTGINFSATAQITSTSAYTVGAGEIFAFMQAVEGFNMADFKWGTANAASITISFWANSSLAGTFGGAVQNSATNRAYPFSYTISAANTWEYKTITVAGDTSGTWLTTNGVGLYLSFGLGSGSTYAGTAGAWTAAAKYTATGATSVVGTNGATFYITGVQLEVGSVATPFEQRQYATELYLCTRYYVGTTRYFFTAGYDPNYSSINSGGLAWSYRMRTDPSIGISGGGMDGHHSIAPTVRSGPNYGGVALQFSGSALRTSVNCSATVDLSLSAEL